MKRKIILFLLGIVLFVVSTAFFWFQYQISLLKPQIEKVFYPVDLSPRNVSGSAFRSVPFDSLLTSKSIIGFGEATHGTDEFRLGFTQLVKRLILVNKCNILVYAERDFGESWELNSYVLNKVPELTLSSALPYSSSHEKELISWIREYNKTKSPDQQIWVASADMYSPRTAALNALAYCQSKNIQLPEHTTSLLNDLGNSPLFFNIFLKKYTLSYITENLKPLHAAVNGSINTNSDLSLEDRWLIQSIKSITKIINFTASKNQIKSGQRDSIMFDNIQWIRQQRKEAKLFVFAHNSHIEKMTGNVMSANEGRLGWLLAKNYEDEYYTIGTEVESGKYRSGKNITFSIPESRNKIGSLIGKSVAASSGFLDLHGNTEVKDFFNKDRYITYGVLDTDRPTYPAIKNFASAFNAVFWIRESSPLIISSANTYNLAVTLSKKKVPDIFKINKVNVKIDLNYKTFSDSGSIYDRPSLGMIVFSNNIFQNYKVIQLNKSDINSILTQNLDSKSDSIVIFIAGDRTKEFALKSITLNNNLVIEGAKMLYSAPNYEREKTNSTEIHLVLKDNNQ